MTLIYMVDGEAHYVNNASEVIIKSVIERSMEAHNEDDGSAIFHIKESDKKDK